MSAATDRTAGLRAARATDSADNYRSINAMAESFFGTLKNERVYRTVYPTRSKPGPTLPSTSRLRYNTGRIHSGLGYRTPQEVHDAWLNSQEVA